MCSNQSSSLLSTPSATGPVFQTSWTGWDPRRPGQVIWPHNISPVYNETPTQPRMWKRQGGSGRTASGCRGAEDVFTQHHETAQLQVFRDKIPKTSWQREVEPFATVPAVLQIYWGNSQHPAICQWFPSIRTRSLSFVLLSCNLIENRTGLRNIRDRHFWPVSNIPRDKLIGGHTQHASKRSFLGFCVCFPYNCSPLYINLTSLFQKKNSS